MDKNLSVATPVKERFLRDLDELRSQSKEGAEYWRGREIMVKLGYTKWENFVDVIGKAQKACESSGASAGNHFLNVRKGVLGGSGTVVEREDYILSRYACYLTAMNGDPRKAEIGFAQSYFAVQTRRQELADAENGLERRLELRDRVKIAGKALNEAAKVAGVQNYALFADAGYRGLYGDLRLKEIKQRKKIAENDQLFDRASRAELAANEFRLTQTEEKLKRTKVLGEYPATMTHFAVGREVRDAIKRIGGTMPEDMPAEESIKKLEQIARQNLSKKNAAISYDDGSKKEI
ncbi:MAG TPA: DNA damage-inducible protein D [Steroidobacteraceae bacterium]|nr:DNA damage-inducible protein D [Steroidobacteraceae bacterium]